MEILRAVCKCIQKNPSLIYMNYCNINSDSFFFKKIENVYIFKNTKSHLNTFLGQKARITIGVSRTNDIASNVYDHMYIFQTDKNKLITYHN